MNGTGEHLVLKNPSVGSVIKKVLAINPELGAERMIDMIRQSIQVQGSVAGEFASAEVIDEANVLRLARETIQS
jgi:hypothetical protein